MSMQLSDSPFAVLTLIAAPAVFTNASSVLALGTANRLGRVVDRTRQISKDLHSNTSHDSPEGKMWMGHLNRLERRATLLVRAMSFFYAAIGSFAGASLLSILAAIVTSYHESFVIASVVSLVAGTVGFIGLAVGCSFLVRETRLALRSLYEEATLVRTWYQQK